MRVPASIRLTSLATVLLAAGGCAQSRAVSAPVPASAVAVVDDTDLALRRLAEERQAVLAGAAGMSPAGRASRMVELGMWDEAESLIAAAPAGDPGMLTAAAKLRLRQHRYLEARRLVGEVLAARPDHHAARLLSARLDVQAWKLAAADATARGLLRRNRRDEDAAVLLGRIALLEKRYDEALEWARRVQGWNAGSPDAYLLEADVRFWNQDPAGAEAPLVRALALNPFDPDARFSYGYAIWRRVDATQLDAMADQWTLALEIDPLHYVTHWHRGNGHTNLTYAGYVQPEDSAVRARLAVADSLISAGGIPEAVALSREVEREFPRSVLPAMLRGSAYYMAWGMDRAARLDSAQAAFRQVLARKPNYGPAHNGLAAVMKQRQFMILAGYDSLEAVIAGTPLPSDPSLEAVFPDIQYYPGDRVARMTRLELGPSIAYLPLIARQGRRYRIPPLHHDLAQAMGRAYFRTATTFDNRQWMDIRGVGSGAAAIEYVERGAHQERNVLLHEFVHLFHGIVFTDAESRRVRELYHQAMEEGRTLDYYASNNESEFLAQAYPAYLSPVKVHPLNHKSMNTADDLRRRDPATHAWVDSLISRQRRYLDGETGALASNWSQVYVNLSESARRRRDGGDPFVIASALLDTAAVWDEAYLPAMISRAALLRDRGRFAEAESWLDRAASEDAAYAPVYAARAELVAARVREEDGDPIAGLERQASLLRQALALERDLAERADLNRRLRELYAEHGRLADAITVAEEYVASGPTISTYLRDRRDEAVAYAHQLRASAGYPSGSIVFLRDLVARKPQNYPHRAQLADALTTAGLLDEAAAVLEEAQAILRAGGSPDPAFSARIAEIRLLQGDTARARGELQRMLRETAEPDVSDLRSIRVLLASGLSTDAHRNLAQHPEPRTPADAAELAYTRGFIADWRGDTEMAVEQYGRAVELNPYHAPARVALAATLTAAGLDTRAADLLIAADGLALPPGPVLRARLDAALR
jgi:hypothetical protein